MSSSTDGVKLVAIQWGYRYGASDGQIYTSADSGATWTPREAVRKWVWTSSSADGSKLVAAVQGGRIYTSTDSGVTWTPRESDRAWQSVASSADGAKLVAGVWGGRIYISTDSGATWTARDPTGGWVSVVSSVDGRRLAAVGDGGYLFTWSAVTTPGAHGGVGGNGISAVELVYRGSDAFRAIGQSGSIAIW